MYNITFLYLNKRFKIQTLNFGKTEKMYNKVREIIMFTKNCYLSQRNIKMKNYKIKTSLFLFYYSWKIVCNTMLYMIYQYG